MISGAAFLPDGDHSGKIVSVSRITEKVFSMDIECPEVSEKSLPGQFVMLRFPERTDPLLARPLAVADASDGVFKVIFSVVGRMTEMLAGSLPGQILMVRGPEGRPFGKPSAERTWLVAGTLGAAPLLYSLRNFADNDRYRFILGVPDISWGNYCNWLKKFSGSEIEVFSEDGSLGAKGNVLCGLPERLGENEEIWACGPDKMLSAICGSYPQDKERIQVSLEKRMACGYGGCVGCVIDTVYGKRRVCVDGPVFRGSEVCWDEL